MPKPPPRPPFEIPEFGDAASDPLTREALHWLVHLHSGNEAPEDWTAFDEWQAASPEHKKAGARAQRIWDHTGSSLLSKYRSKSPKLPIVIAAVIGLSALGFFSGLFGDPAWYFADHRSSTGEVKQVVLKDGSEVILDTGTSFDVSDGDRTIKLHSGQVYVTVKPSPERPFTVLAGNARAQALGTAFAVRRDRQRAAVVVTESAVQVSDIASSKSVRVGAGHAVSLDRSEGLDDPQSVDAAALTAWRNGEIKFVNRPLREVVAELERYRRGKIVVVGGAIGDLPVRATVDIAKADEFLESLQVVLPVRVSQWPGFVAIYPATSR